MRDDWSEQFENWKKTKVAKTERKPEPKFTQRELSLEPKAPMPHISTHHKAVHHTRLLIFLIPILFITYILWTNVIAGQTFTYYYDISPETNYLTPTARVSQASEMGGATYQNLTGRLVYFNAPLPRGAEDINVKIRFADTLDNESRFSLGARDAQEWRYTYKKLYDPTLSGLETLERNGTLYKVNSQIPDLELNSVSRIDNIVIATDGSYKGRTSTLNYNPGETFVQPSLRGGHIFYLYTKGDFKADINKQDLNWYANSDELNVTLETLDGKILAELTIPDDGITNATQKQTPVQHGSLTAKDLPEGVYVLRFKDFDGLIRGFYVNTGKIVTDKLYFADSELFKMPQKESAFFYNSSRPSNLDLITFHAAGIQSFTYQNPGQNTKTFSLSKEDEWVQFPIEAGEYDLKTTKNDVIVSAPSGWLSFSQSGYFEPFTQRVIPLSNNWNWISTNADYIVTEYQTPQPDGDGWVIAETNFKVSKDALKSTNGQLSFVFNAPDLATDEALQNGTNVEGIPIDWIEIKIYKPGIFG